MSLKLSSREESEVVGVKKTCHVFWDYENCQKPTDKKFEEAYVAVRDTLESINLSMRGLNIYCDENLMERGSRQTLNDLGCSVINPSKLVGSIKKKETSDLRIAVDISMYAFDNANNPENCAIVLITSDSDFGHLLSQMRSRSFEIILICAKGAPERLTVHANRCIRIYDLFVQTEEAATTTPISSNSLQALSLEPVLEDDDNNSIISLQHEQELLRIDDLVKLVQELQSKNSEGVVHDAAVGNEFRKRFPVLAQKGLYKATKFAAIRIGKLFSSEVPNPGHPSAYLLSTNRPHMRFN